eukprot:244779_1
MAVDPFFEIGIKITFYSSYASACIMCIAGIKLVMLFRQEQSIDHLETLYKNHLYLYYNAFGVIISTIVASTIYAIWHSQDQYMQLTHKRCHVIIALYNVMWGFTRFFYYNFMLYRVKSVFEKPLQLRINKKCYYSLLIVSYIMLILMCFIGWFWHFNADEKLKICISDIRTATLFGLGAKFIIGSISLVDALMISIILSLFLIRLCKMRHHRNTDNEKLNKWIKRQIIIGVLCTSTSLLLFIRLTIYNSRYKYLTYSGVVWNMIINGICVVLTFDPHCNRCGIGSSHTTNNTYHVAQQTINNSTDITLNIELSRVNTYNTDDRSTKEHNSDCRQLPLFNIHNRFIENAKVVYTQLLSMGFYKLISHKISEFAATRYLNCIICEQCSFGCIECCDDYC